MSKRMKLLLPLIIWVVLIIVSSTMSYEQQDIRPLLADFPGADTFARLFGWVQFTYGHSVVSIDYLGTAGFIEFFIRKGMHVFAFAVLAFLLYRMFINLGWSSLVSAASAFVVSVGFAAIDEIRQAFHPDRSGMWQDVALDTVGVIIGMSLAYVVYRKKETDGRLS